MSTRPHNEAGRKPRDPGGWSRCPELAEQRLLQVRSRLTKRNATRVGSKKSMWLCRDFVGTKRRYDSTEKPILNLPSHNARVLGMQVGLEPRTETEYQLILAEPVHNLLFFRTSTPRSLRMTPDDFRESPIVATFDRTLRAVLGEVGAGSVFA